MESICIVFKYCPDQIFAIVFVFEKFIVFVFKYYSMYLDPSMPYCHHFTVEKLHAIEEMVAVSRRKFNTLRMCVTVPCSVGNKPCLDYHNRCISNIRLQSSGDLYI